MKNRCRIVGFILVLAGILCIAIKGITPETIDANGILHEAFFLLPAGFGCIFAGLLLVLVSLLRRKA